MKFVCFILGMLFGVAALTAILIFLEDDTDYQRPDYHIFSEKELRDHSDTFHERKCK